ncbi:hypothetical protein B0H19DRAFT_1229010 [Mycena capillaripes]|nr:hypothetical protein B0H19DRAFT_1229010 [Mycena capillaripes]
MSAFSPTESSILGSALSTSSTSASMLAVIIVVVVAGIIHYVSPMRLMRVLVAAIAKTENTYLEALETGWLPPSDDQTAERLSTLQLEVSVIREAYLRNSLSRCTALREFLKGRTFTVLQCINEVRKLETHLEILKETQLRESKLNPLNRMRTVSLRQRQFSGSNSS